MVKRKRTKEMGQAIRKFVEPREKKILRETAVKIKKQEKLEREAYAKRHMKSVKVKSKKGKTTTKLISMGEYRKRMVTKVFKSKSDRKGVKKRERATSNVLKAFGVISGPASRSGAGRPRGTYKYGNMPIHIYKKMMRDKKAQYQMYQQEQAMKLSSRGFTQEQLQQLQQQQSIAEMQQPQQYDAEEYDEEQDYEEPQQYQEMPQSQPQASQVQQKQGYGRIIPRSQQIQAGRSVADDELDFRQWSAEKTISPRTQRVLDTIRRIQNKGKTDNIEQQRRHRERGILSRMTSLLKSHENMINVDMDFTGVKDDNPLMAQNIWKNNPNNNIMRTNRRNILDAGENQLKFF